MQIRLEIKNFINNVWSDREEWVSILSERVGISSWVISSLLKDDNKNRKFFKQTLDILYGFFDLPRDHFYKANLKKRYPKTLSILWSLFRAKRCELGLDIRDVASITQIDRRALARLEAGDSMPNENSYTIKTLCRVLKFDEKEIKKIGLYIQTYKDIEKISKKYTLE